MASTPGFRSTGRWAAAALFALTAAAPAFAVEEEEAEPSLLDGVPSLSKLRSARDAMADRGVLFSGLYFSDVRSDVHGGIERGATYSGLLSLAVDLDGEKIAGVEGGRLHANLFQIHGRDVSDEFVGNVLSSNDIGARPTTRLFELWYEQKIGDRLDVRVGQMATDVEFITSDYGEAFINATFGWAGPPSENLPQGGPAYPLATPGVRLRYAATDDLTILAAVFNGTAARPDAVDPEKANRYGLNFRVGDPPLVLIEGQYRWNHGGDAEGLPGTFKFGGYGHFAKFDDLKYGTDGRVLGSAASNGVPRSHRGDVNVYALVDQQVWRAPGGDDEQGIGVFLRAIAGPTDRNEISFYVDGGVVWTGPLPGRPRDKFGVAAAYADFSPKLADADRAANAAAGMNGPVSDYEAVIEVNYKAEIVSGLTVQPTFQYVWRPGGGAADPRGNGSTRIGNAAIVGLTTIARF